MANNPHLYAMIAGEMSGDTLGAGLMKAILRRDPQAQFIGIGGPKMIRLGFKSYFSIEKLAVMGITEVLSKLIPILKIRHQISSILKNARPCVLIGIDAPDFNLTVERRLKQLGIPTVHYVSPSVWAWRQGRMKTIKASCDKVLTLLPFEKEFYDKNDMACEYVGHTLANQIDLDIDPEVCRERIDLYRRSVEKITDKVMGIMPGSRAGIIETMLPIYCQVARSIKKRMPKVCFVSSVPNYELATLIKNIWLENAPDLSITVYVGATDDVIASCDAILLTSGTIALQSMLLKVPFAVAYKVSSVTALIGRRMLKVDTYSLPNLIAKHKVVNEYIQEDCTPDKLSDEMFKLLNSDNLLMKKEFRTMHEAMRCSSDDLAATAVLDLIASRAAAEPVMSVEQKTADTAAQGAEADKTEESIQSAVKQDIEPEMTLPTSEEVFSENDKTEPKFGGLRD